MVSYCTQYVLGAFENDVRLATIRYLEVVEASEYADQVAELCNDTKPAIALLVNGRGAKFGNLVISAAQRD